MLDRLGRPADAEALLYRALELDPNYEEAHYNIGCLHRKRGNIAAAIASLQRAVEIDPQYGVALAELGSALAIRGPSSESTFQEAYVVLSRALAIDPTNGWTHAGLATVTGPLLRYDESEAHYQQATRLLPAQARLWMYYGRFKSQRGQASEAERILLHAMSLDPDDAVLRDELAEHHDRMAHRAEFNGYDEP